MYMGAGGIGAHGGYRGIRVGGGLEVVSMVECEGR